MLASTCQALILQDLNLCMILYNFFDVVDTFHFKDQVLPQNILLFPRTFIASFIHFLRQS